MTREFAGWLAVVLPLAYVVILSIKARRTANRCAMLTMSVKALKDVLKDSNEEVARKTAEISNLRFDLRKQQVFNYDLTTAPSGYLQLLTRGGARLVEPLGSLQRAVSMGIVAWAPVARRDWDEEVRLRTASEPRKAP